MNNKFYRGEIWLMDLNPSRGHEQSGIRPGLIISDNRFNKGKSDLIIVCPVTSKSKNNPLQVELSPPEGGLKVRSYIKCEDIKSISKERCISKWGNVSEKTIHEVEYIVKMILGFK